MSSAAPVWRSISDIKARLAHNRDNHPLFDTDRFRRHIEAAYATMCERARSGKPPASFAVARSGDLH